MNTEKLIDAVNNHLLDSEMADILANSRNAVSAIVASLRDGTHDDLADRLTGFNNSHWTFVTSGFATTGLEHWKDTLIERLELFVSYDTIARANGLDGPSLDASFGILFDARAFCSAITQLPAIIARGDWNPMADYETSEEAASGSLCKCCLDGAHLEPIPTPQVETVRQQAEPLIDVIVDFVNNGLSKNIACNELFNTYPSKITEIANAVSISTLYETLAGRACIGAISGMPLISILNEESNAG